MVISGISLLKGIGVGEAIASDRFSVGGHEWILLFYPDGKLSGEYSDVLGHSFAAIFVVLVGEDPSPKGVIHPINSTERIIRTFYRFSLIDQKASPARRPFVDHRERANTHGVDGVVKMACAGQDPSACSCHGYHSFVLKTDLEPRTRYVVHDAIIIQYEIEVVVAFGGVLNQIPYSIGIASCPTLGDQMNKLRMDDTDTTDCVFEVEGERFSAHSFIMSARSSTFRAMLRTGANMVEGIDGVMHLRDIRAPVFSLLVHFVYTDSLPDKEELNVAMAQHLLAAADRFDVSRLPAICESRLCDSLNVDTAATTLALAEQNHAQGLKQVCLKYVASHLVEVINTDGYGHLEQSCPQLAQEIIRTVGGVTVNGTGVVGGTEFVGRGGNGGGDDIQRILSIVGDKDYEF
jgi:speckle-type POZ protein